ncbi:MAG: dihydroorotase [Bacillota bacterium]|jgi:allantoinase
MHLLLKNACYYTKNGFKTGSIGIKDGKISCFSDDFADKYHRVLDLKGLIVLPGLVDSHVHFRDPGPNCSEDFFSGSCAAAAGGITTACEMPNVEPPVSSVATLQKRILQMEQKSLIDMAFYGAAGFTNRYNLQELLFSGVVAMKTFLAPGIPGLSVADDGELYLLLKEAAQTSGRYMFHCENQQVIDHLEQALQEQGLTDNSFHYLSRPQVAEIESVSTIIQFAKATGAKVGVCHISVPEACALVRGAQLEGVDIIAETCWHYLIFDHSYIDQFGPYAKCNPPLRSRRDVELLWDYLADGTISMIGSDHAPHHDQAKRQGLAGPIWQAPSGLASIEVMLPMMLSQVNKGRLTLEQLVALMSENTCKNLGLYPQKGCLTVGSDADFTIIDMNKSYVIHKEDLQTGARETAVMFDGLTVKGRPVYTIVRGQVIMDHGQLDLSKKGQGRFVSRTEPKNET